MGNKEILAAVELALSTQRQYGLSVEYEAEGNPILKVAPAVKATPDSLLHRKKTFFHE